VEDVLAVANVPDLKSRSTKEYSGLSKEGSKSMGICCHYGLDPLVLENKDIVLVASR